MGYEPGMVEFMHDPGILREGWIEYTLRPELAVRAGLVQTPATRQLMVPPELQQFVDVGMAAADVGGMMPGWTDRNRDYGLAFHGALGCDGQVQYLVTVTNEDTDVTETNRYYYDLEDNLLGWIRTPDLGTATTYDERQYVRIGDFAIGEMARSWVSGSTTRHTYIHTTEPLGLETAAFEFEHPGGASVSYNPSTVVRQWSAFGRPLVATGSGVALPTRFPGQLELRGTDVRIWSSGSNVAHRDGLYLNRWRVYDPRVGQYLQPDPAASDGHLLGASVFVYGDARPADEIDPTGRVGWVMCWCGRPARNLLECVAVCWVQTLRERQRLRTRTLPRVPTPRSGRSAYEAGHGVRVDIVSGASRAGGAGLTATRVFTFVGVMGLGTLVAAGAHRRHPRHSGTAIRSRSRCLFQSPFRSLSSEVHLTDLERREQLQLSSTTTVGELARMTGERCRRIRRVSMSATAPLPLIAPGVLAECGRRLPSVSHLWLDSGIYSPYELESALNGAFGSLESFRSVRIPVTPAALVEICRRPALQSFDVSLGAISVGEADHQQAWELLEARSLSTAVLRDCTRLSHASIAALSRGLAAGVLLIDDPCCLTVTGIRSLLERCGSVVVAGRSATKVGERTALLSEYGGARLQFAPEWPVVSR